MKYGSKSGMHQGQKHRSGGQPFQGQSGSRQTDTYGSPSQSGRTLHQRSTSAAPISQSMAKRNHQGQGHSGRTRGTAAPTGKGSISGTNKSRTSQGKSTYEGNHAY